MTNAEVLNFSSVLFYKKQLSSSLLFFLFLLFFSLTGCGEYSEDDFMKESEATKERPSIKASMEDSGGGEGDVRKIQFSCQAENFMNDPDKLYYSWTVPALNEDNSIDRNFWWRGNKTGEVDFSWEYLLNPVSLQSALMNGEYQFYSPTGDKLYDESGKRKYPYGRKFETYEAFCKYYFGDRWETDCFQNPNGDPDSDGYKAKCGGELAGTIDFQGSTFDAYRLSDDAVILDVEIEKTTPPEELPTGTGLTPVVVPNPSGSGNVCEKLGLRSARTPRNGSEYCDTDGVPGSGGTYIFACDNKGDGTCFITDTEMPFYRDTNKRKCKGYEETFDEPSDPVPFNIWVYQGKRMQITEPGLSYLPEYINVPGSNYVGVYGATHFSEAGLCKGTLPVSLLEKQNQKSILEKVGVFQHFSSLVPNIKKLFSFFQNDQEEEKVVASAHAQENQKVQAFSWETDERLASPPCSSCVPFSCQETASGSERCYYRCPDSCQNGQPAPPSSPSGGVQNPDGSASGTFGFTAPPNGIVVVTAVVTAPLIQGSITQTTNIGGDVIVLEGVPIDQAYYQGNPYGEVRIEQNGTVVGAGTGAFDLNPNASYSLVLEIYPTSPENTKIHAIVYTGQFDACVNFDGTAMDLQDRSIDLSDRRARLTNHIFTNAYGDLSGVWQQACGNGAEQMYTGDGKFTNCEEWNFGADPRRAEGFSSIKERTGIGDILPDEAVAVGLNATDLKINFPKDYPFQNLAGTSGFTEGKIAVACRTEGIDLNRYIVGTENYDGVEDPPASHLAGDEANVTPAFLPVTPSTIEKTVRIVPTVANVSSNEAVQFDSEVTGFRAYSLGNLLYRWKLVRITDDGDVDIISDEEKPNPKINEWKKGANTLQFKTQEVNGYRIRLEVIEPDDLPSDGSEPDSSSIVSDELTIDIAGIGIGALMYECIANPGTEEIPVLPSSREDICPNVSSIVRLKLTAADPDRVVRYVWKVDDTTQCTTFSNEENPYECVFPITKRIGDGPHKAQVYLFHEEDAEDQPFFVTQEYEINIKAGRVVLDVNGDIILPLQTKTLEPGEYTVRAIPQGLPSNLEYFYEWSPGSSGVGETFATETFEVVEGESKKISVTIYEGGHSQGGSGKRVSGEFTLAGRKERREVMSNIENVFAKGKNTLFASPYQFLPESVQRGMNIIGAISFLILIGLVVKQFVGK